MTKELDSIVANELDQIEPTSFQVIIMGTIFVFINLFLMISISLYWINPSIHQYFSGKPL